MKYYDIEPPGDVPEGPGLRVAPHTPERLHLPEVTRVSARADDEVLSERVRSPLRTNPAVRFDSRDCDRQSGVRQRAPEISPRNLTTRNLR